MSDPGEEIAGIDYAEPRSSRIAQGLRWAAATFAVLGLLIVFGSMWLSTTVDALLAGARIGGIALGIPAVVAFAIAEWLDR